MPGMHRATAGPGTNGSQSQCWLARLSLVFAALAIAIVAVEAGLKSFAMLAVGLAGAAVSLTVAFFFLSRRGVRRWLSLAAFALGPIAVIVSYALASLLWVAIVSAAGWLLAGLTARWALAGNKADWRMPEHPAQPPTAHPFVIMNPRSGGGKVAKFDLKRKAEALGAEVFLIGGPERVDVAEVARAAVARGADLLGVAGGDGTQALVAAIAAEHGIPFVVITAVTAPRLRDLGRESRQPHPVWPSGGRSSTCCFVMFSRIPASTDATALTGMATCLRPHRWPSMSRTWVTFWSAGSTTNPSTCPIWPSTACTLS